MSSAAKHGPAKTVACVQGLFNLSTGLWPVFHRRSFERVTGPKTDFWLVRTVGLTLACAGLTLTMAGMRRRVTPEVKLLGGALAGSLAGVDVFYGVKGRISRIYLADAAVELAIVLAWLKTRESGNPGSAAATRRTPLAARIESSPG